MRKPACMNAIQNTAVIAAAVVAAAVLLLMGSLSVAYAQDESSAKDMYKAAQRSLNNEEYREAADAFKKVFEKHESSKYAGDSMYWYAFSLYRLGGRSNLRKASDALEVQMDRYGGNGDDAAALYYRVLGERARNGDEDAARKLEEAKADLGTAGDNMETKLMAMEALLNMDEDRALPILRSVLANQSPSTVELREKAVFLLSQHESDESVELLIATAGNDPSRKVREQAVFWLSQVGSEAAVAFLEELVTTHEDMAIRKKAIFAISQQETVQGTEILKRIALDKDVDTGLRAEAIFWIGQRGRRSDTEFLIELYGRIDDDALKEKVIFSVSQADQGAGVEFLMATATNNSETMEMRNRRSSGRVRQDSSMSKIW